MMIETTTLVACGCGGGFEGLIGMEQKGTLWCDRNVLYFVRDIGHIIICMCQASSNYTLKRPVHSIICKLCISLKKTELPQEPVS